MGVEPHVRLSEQLAVEARFAATRLVTADQENCLPPRVESEGHAPATMHRIRLRIHHPARWTTPRYTYGFKCMLHLTSLSGRARQANSALGGPWLLFEENLADNPRFSM